MGWLDYLGPVGWLAEETGVFGSEGGATVGELGLDPFGEAYSGAVVLVDEAGNVVGGNPEGQQALAEGGDYDVRAAPLAVIAKKAQAKRFKRIAGAIAIAVAAGLIVWFLTRKKRRRRR